MDRDALEAGSYMRLPLKEEVAAWYKRVRPLLAAIAFLCQVVLTFLVASLPGIGGARVGLGISTAALCLFVLVLIYQSLPAGLLRQVSIPTVAIASIIGFAYSWGVRLYVGDPPRSAANSDLIVTPEYVFPTRDRTSFTPFVVYYKSAHAIERPNWAVYLRVVNRLDYPVTIISSSAKALIGGKWVRFAITHTGPPARIYYGPQLDNMALQPLSEDFAVSAKDAIAPHGHVTGWLLYEYPPDVDLKLATEVRVTLEDDNGGESFSDLPSNPTSQSEGLGMIHLADHPVEDLSQATVIDYSSPVQRAP